MEFNKMEFNIEVYMLADCTGTSHEVYESDNRNITKGKKVHQKNKRKKSNVSIRQFRFFTSKRIKPQR